jgi:hypothetical protein
MTKYKAIRTKIDGITFASKKEAHRYTDLKTLEKHNKIRDLKLQPCFPFKYDDKVMFRYYADFEYYENDEYIVEDVKGVKTSVYKLKKKLIEAQYKIRITEV